MLYEHLVRYLKEFWTILLIFEFSFQLQNVLWMHAILLSIFVTSLVHGVTIILFYFVFRF